MIRPKRSSSEKVLKLRKRVKQKKPKFVRAESWRYARLKDNWRRPQGLDHKVRLHRKGWPPAVSSGYGGPKSAKHLHPSGYVEALVSNVDQLARIDSETHAVRIAHTVGKRKKIGIIAEARRRRLVILNLKETPTPTDERLLEAEAETESEQHKEEDVETEGSVETRERTRKRRGRPAKR